MLSLVIDCQGKSVYSVQLPEFQFGHKVWVLSLTNAVPHINVIPFRNYTTEIQGIPKRSSNSNIEILGCITQSWGRTSLPYAHRQRANCSMCSKKKVSFKHTEIQMQSIILVLTFAEREKKKCFSKEENLSVPAFVLPRHPLSSIMKCPEYRHLGMTLQTFTRQPLAPCF